MTVHPVRNFGVLAALLCIQLGCSGASSLSPTAPTAVTDGTASSTGASPSADEPAAVPGASGSGAVQRCTREDLVMPTYADSGQFQPAMTGGAFTLPVTNTSSHACELTLTSWDRNNASSIVLTDGQVRVDAQRYTLAAGQSTVLGPIRLPEGCYQLDVSNGGGQPIPDRANHLDAIRWHTGGSCQPTPGSDPPVCSAGLSLSAIYSGGQVVVQSTTATSVSPRPMRIWYRIDGGAVQEAAGTLGQSLTYAVTATSQPRTFDIRATTTMDNQAACTAEASVTVPPDSAPPPPPPPAGTCEGTVTELVLVPDVTAVAHASGVLVSTLRGEQLIGELIVDGVSSSPTDGARMTYRFDRPQPGGASVVKTATLRGRVNGALCGEKQVTITLSPQDRPPTCEGTVTNLEILANPMTAAAVSGKLRSTLRGDAVVGELVLDGLSSHPADGGLTPYQLSRPSAGASALTRTATLTSRVNGQVCGTRSVTLTAPPQAATCEGAVTRLELLPGAMTATEVTGTLRATVQGPGATGALTSFDGSSTTVADGASVPYRVARPAFGSPALGLQALLRNSIGGQACGQESVPLTVPPREGTCEQQNPKSIAIDSSSVVESGDATSLVVSFSARTFTGTLGLLHTFNGVVSGIKARAELAAPCGAGPARGTLEMQRSGSIFKPSAGAAYYLVVLHGDQVVETIGQIR